jgi:predicted RNA-binding Zn ribbon-like protein
MRDPRPAATLGDRRFLVATRIRPPDRDLTVVLARNAPTAGPYFAARRSDAGRIRECGDPPCRRLLADTSRAGSRRWCEMSGCGNRAEAAGFRARRAGGHSG